ncbi:hypothetical protein [Persicirhabdus sediminis]|uniref:Uncharacterized protein n=1 Tax=Persicirhabdus sediminis TaxID=454144 RepID=A0A8J7MBT0_9BACT|nr:hypothetical protein [Persicirhabdus sediminis]MBK1790101.1 hypothetical protein [Persicirhabdus sediminis]
MTIFRLSLATLIQRKVWVIALLLALLCPMVLPYMTPVDVSPALLPPARAQMAWNILWILTLFWLLFQSARFGEDHSKSGMGAYFLSRGQGRLQQLLQLWLANLSMLLALLVITVLMCLIFAMPEDPVQASQWRLLNGQYFVLVLLSMAPLMLLATALGSRFGSTIAYVVPVFLALYGMYGVGYLQTMTTMRMSPALEWIYVVSPHYHLAELTTRMVFKQGHLLVSDFIPIVGYFCCLAMLLFSLSALIFKAKAV